MPATKRPFLLRAYLIASKIAAPLARIALSRRLNRGKEDPTRYTEKLGQTDAVRPDGQLIWFHAVGVGEVLALSGLLREIIKLRPKVQFLITTSAKTAAQALAHNMPPNSIHQFLPLDCDPFIRSFLDHWHPDASIWAERDIWPALIEETKQRNIPMAIVNGKMSDASFNSKQRARSLYAATYQSFNFIDVQDEESALYFGRLGVPKDLICVSGSLKMSSTALQTFGSITKTWDAVFDGEPVWLAASTHEGEEEFALLAHKEILKSSPTTKLVIAARDPHRAASIAELAQSHGFSTHSVSALDAQIQTADIYIETEIGRMGHWYSIAQSAFVGGSIADIGGHNPYEAVRLNCAVIHGPKIQNFKDDYAKLDNAGAARLVHFPSDLAKAIMARPNQSSLANAVKIADENNTSLSALAKRIIELVNGDPVRTRT